MKIFVIGDAFLDKYLIGHSNRLSAEAAIPVVDVDYELTFPGGAANVRQNLVSLGVDGKMLFKALSTPQNYPLKTRLMVGDQQVSRWDVDDWCEAFTVEDCAPLLDADAIIVSDYGKGSVTEEVIQYLRGVNIPLFVDTKRDPTAWIGSDAILFPNASEYNQYRDTYEWIEKVVLKKSGEGLALLEYGKQVLQAPAMASFVRSVNGAGDTVIAAFAIALRSGCELRYCLQFANAAAAVAVENPYTYAPQLIEVDKKLLAW